MNNDKKFTLKFKHKDFICKQLALFKLHRQVAEEIIAQLKSYLKGLGLTFGIK